MNKARPSNTIFDRMVNQLTTAAAQAASSALPNSPQLMSPTPDSESSRLGQLMKLSGIATLTTNKGAKEDGNFEKLFEEGDGELDLAISQKMLKWHAEAVGRMVELSASGDVSVAHLSVSLCDD